MRQARMMTLMVVAVFALTTPAWPQVTPLPDTPLVNTAPPTPVGSGARAMGYGGAFIAIADDATAASWNPAGLIQLLTPEAGLALTREYRDINGQKFDFNQINYLSVVWPFQVANVNMVGSLNYQRLYDFYYMGDSQKSIDKNVNLIEMVDSDVGLVNNYTLFYREMKTDSTKILGDVGAISPAFAIQVTPQLSVGFTYNFWADGIIGDDYQYEYQHQRVGSVGYEQSDWIDVDLNCTCNGGLPCDTSQPYPQMIDNPNCLNPNVDFLINGPVTGGTELNSHIKRTDKLSLAGQNFNVGMMLRLSPRVTMGVVYRSEFGADLERSSKFWHDGVLEKKTKTNETMIFPASYGVGTAFRFSDALTLSADVTRVDWHRFLLEPEQGTRISPVNGLPEDLAEIDPTHSARAGLEYLIIMPRYVVPIRAGVFYDPEPARGQPDDYYGISLGGGLVYEWLVLDFAYWYRWGDDVIISTTASQDPATGEITDIKEDRGDIRRQMFMVSAVVHTP